MIYIEGINKSIPTSYSEVDFETYIKLMKCGNDTTKLLSLFTGVDEETLKKAKIINFEEVAELLSFVSQEQVRNDIPTVVGGYPIHKDLNLEHLGAYQDLQKVVDSFKLRKDGDPIDFDDLARYAEICAIYVHSYTSDEYDSEAIEKITPVMMKAPCWDVLTIGNRAISKLISLRFNIKLSDESNSPLNKFQQALTAWRTSMTFSMRFTLWKWRFSKRAMNFLK